jgi:hypothetical protein
VSPKPAGVGRLPNRQQQRSASGDHTGHGPKEDTAGAVGHHINLLRLYGDQGPDLLLPCAGPALVYNDGMGGGCGSPEPQPGQDGGGAQRGAAHILDKQSCSCSAEEEKMSGYEWQSGGPSDHLGPSRVAVGEVNQDVIYLVLANRKCLEGIKSPTVKITIVLLYVGVERHPPERYESV